jgi:hypothetical protein
MYRLVLFAEKVGSTKQSANRDIGVERLGQIQQAVRELAISVDFKSSENGG